MIILQGSPSLEEENDILLTLATSSLELWPRCNVKVMKIVFSFVFIYVVRDIIAYMFEKCISDYLEVNAWRFNFYGVARS